MPQPLINVSNVLDTLNRDLIASHGSFYQGGLNLVNLLEHLMIPSLSDRRLEWYLASLTLDLCPVFNDNDVMFQYFCFFFIFRLVFVGNSWRLSWRICQNNYQYSIINLHVLWWWGLWCLTPLSTIFQLYRGGQFYWWSKPEYTVR